MRASLRPAGSARATSSGVASSACAHLGALWVCALGRAAVPRECREEKSVPHPPQARHATPRPSASTLAGLGARPGHPGGSCAGVTGCRERAGSLPCGLWGTWLREQRRSLQKPASPQASCKQRAASASHTAAPPDTPPTPPTLPLPPLSRTPPPEGGNLCVCVVTVYFYKLQNL